MDDLKINYLTWIKNIEVLTHGCLDCHDMTSSAVSEPTEILIRYIQQIGDKNLRERIKEPNPWGQPHLIEGIAKRYGINPDRILITSGASQAIYIICRALLGRDDQVIVEEPIYEPLLAAPMAQRAQIESIRRKAVDNYGINLDELSEKVTRQTKLVILTNLHNPSGAWINDEKLMDILRVAQKYSKRVKILVDEVFHDFVKEKQRPAATLDESFISVNSLSKVYGLSLLRVGWILADTDVIHDLRQTYVLIENNGSRLNEGLASLVVEKLDIFDDYWRDIIFRNNRTAKEIITPLLEEELIQGEVLSNCSTYFPKIKDVIDSSHFVKRLAHKWKVFLVPGYFFAAPEHVRIGLGGDPQKLQKGLELLANEIRVTHNAH